MTGINIHSMTDAITNSSTTIYTFSDKSPAACREMIDAIFKAFNIGLKCDDVFTLVVTMDNDYMYGEWLDRIGSEIDGDLDQLIEDVQNGKVEKPKWMFDCENDSNYGRSGDTTLHISPKKPEYSEVAERIGKFLYSTESVECSS